MPADWKLADVIPVYQKGMREDTGNYRPVSLTSLLGKIYRDHTGTTERHLKNNTTIKHSQHELTKGKPCVTHDTLL